MRFLIESHLTRSCYSDYFGVGGYVEQSASRWMCPYVLWFHFSNTTPWVAAFSIPNIVIWWNVSSNRQDLSGNYNTTDVDCCHWWTQLALLSSWCLSLGFRGYKILPSRDLLAWISVESRIPSSFCYLSGLLYINLEIIVKWLEVNVFTYDRRTSIKYLVDVETKRKSWVVSVTPKWLFSIFTNWHMKMQNIVFWTSPSTMIQCTPRPDVVESVWKFC